MFSNTMTLKEITYQPQSDNQITTPQSSIRLSFIVLKFNINKLYAGYLLLQGPENVMLLL